MKIGHATQNHVRFPLARTWGRLMAALVIGMAVALGIAQPARAGGCNDPYELNGTGGESLTSPATTLPIPSSVQRSLCGFYDGDYFAFTATTGVSYRIEITNFSAPQDLQFALYRGSGNNFTYVGQGGGVTTYITPPLSGGAHVFSLTSGASQLGSYGGGDYTLSISIEGSPPPATPALATLTLNPTSVRGGGTSIGTVTLSSAAPEGGATVSLASSSSTARVPASVTVPAGATSATFTITTNRVLFNTSATISASSGGVTKTARLTITRR